MKPMTLEQAREFVKRNAMEYEDIRQKRKAEERDLQYIAEVVFATQKNPSFLTRVGQWVRSVV